MSELKQWVINDLDWILTLVTAVVTATNLGAILWTRATVLKQEADRRTRMAEILTTPGKSPGVMIVDLLKGIGVEAAAKRYVTQTLGEEVPNERVRVVSRDKHLGPEDLEGVQLDVKRAYGELANMGVGTIHLFYAGPTVVAPAVGAILSNGPEVVLYAYERGEYTPFGPLEFLN